MSRIAAAATRKNFTNFHWRMAYVPFGADLLYPPGTSAFKAP